VVHAEPGGEAAERIGPPTRQLRVLSLSLFFSNKQKKRKPSHVSHAVPIMDHLTCTQEKAKYRIQSVRRYDNSRLGRDRQTKPSSSINVQNGTMIFMRPVKLSMPIWPTGGETPRVSRRQRSVCTWTRGRRVHQAHRVASSWQSLTDTLAHENHTRAPGQPLHVSKAPLRIIARSIDQQSSDC
jgi:hypothetical protein